MSSKIRNTAGVVTTTPRWASTYWSRCQHEDCSDNEALSQECFDVFVKSLVGMQELEARAACEARLVPCRITRRGTEHPIGTRDLRGNRCGLEIDGGIVTKVNIG